MGLAFGPGKQKPLLSIICTIKAIHLSAVPEEHQSCLSG
jgi:hypothetical protein